MTIYIKKSTTADTRTCDWSKVTKEQLLEASLQHISDIKAGFKFFIYMMHRQSELHDLTKISHIDGCMAGMARSGEYRQEFISPDLLVTAYKNTVWSTRKIKAQDAKQGG